MSYFGPASERQFGAKVEGSQDELTVTDSATFGLVKFDHPDGSFTFKKDQAESIAKWLLGVYPHGRRRID